MLLRDDSLVLSIKLFPLFLENFSAYDFMLLNSISLELSSAALATGHKLLRIYIVFSDIELVLFVDISNALTLKLF